MDFDLSLDDMIRSSYRLSWPAPAAKAGLSNGGLRRVLHRALGRALEQCGRGRLEGWPVALSAPANNETIILSPAAG